jgi:hypothetical protein
MRNSAHQTRANRTITIDFHNEATYFRLLHDGKAFVECVLAWLLLDSRVVDVPMSYNPTFVTLSSLKPFFFSGLKDELQCSAHVGAKDPGIQ